MKLSKKKVFALALAVCLIATLSLGSLAWFTDDDSVTNNFYVGDSTTDPDKVFGIDVWETVNGVDYGKDTKDDEGAKYEAILPGEKLSKAPYLTNTGIHPQYVRAIVTVSDAYYLREAMEGAWGDADKFLAGTPESWTLEDILFVEGDKLVYVYYYNTVLEAGATTDAIFNEVVIPTGLNKEQAAEIGDFQISILGQVIQSEHILVDNAKDAFAKYWDAEGTIAGYTDDQIKANAKVNEEAETDVYMNIDVEPTAEISVTGATISVSEAVFKIDPAVLNCTIIIDSCDITVADGGYIAYFGSVGGQQVCMSTDTTINGVNARELYKSDYDAFQAYFHNIDAWTIVWFNN